MTKIKVDESTKDALKRYGDDFQYVCVKVLIEDPKFLPAINKIIDQNMFSFQEGKIIVGVILDLWRTLKHPLTWSEVQWAYFKKVGDDENKRQLFTELRAECDKVDPGQVAYVKKEFTTFTMIKRAFALSKEGMREMLDDADPKTVTKFINKWKELTNYGEDESVSTVMSKDYILDVLTETDDDIIPTFIPGMDERIGGGLEKGGIGYFLAPTGFGKTTFSTVLAYNCAINGYKVLQIYFEDRPTDIARKHLSQLIGNYPISKLKNLKRDASETFINNNLGDAQKTLESNLIMLRMEDRKTTVEDIEAKMNEFVDLNGFRPDLVIIDYFSCLMASRNPNKDKTEAESDCMRKIKNLALTYNVAMWVMQQTNRLGASGEQKGSMANVQGAFQATQPASLWLELARTQEQKHENRADIIIVKCRHANGDPVFQDIVFNNGKMYIDCTTETEDTFDPEYHPDAKPPFEMHDER